MDMKKLFARFVEWNFHQILNLHFKRNKGVIIQLGANDGQTIDPVYFLIRKQKNRAVLLEPVPYVFERLKETYKGMDSVRLLNMAITEREEKSLPFYYLKEVPEIPYDKSYSWFGSFSKDHIEKFRSGVPGFDEMLTVENLPCVTINQLIKDYPEVSLLHIDVEGFDAKIILSMDFNIKPEIILFEHIHIESGELSRCLTKLRAEGYRTYSYGFDTICVRSEIKTDILLRIVKLFKPKIFR